MALKIACGQIEIIAGRPDLNSKKILHHMDMACQNGIDILLLPELAVPGYFLGDLWEPNSFHRRLRCLRRRNHRRHGKLRRAVRHLRQYSRR